MVPKIVSLQEENKKLKKQIETLEKQKNKLKEENNAYRILLKNQLEDK